MSEQKKPFKHPSFYPGDAVETEHPFSLYISVWILLFVLSAFSYAVDLMQVEGYLRWFLVTVFAFLKAGLVVGVFMHMAWERMAFLYAITLPPLFCWPWLEYWLLMAPSYTTLGICLCR